MLPETFSLHAVVVGVDGSAEALRAVRAAAAEAARRRLALRVIATYPPPPGSGRSDRGRWRPYADAHRVGAEAVDEALGIHPDLPVELSEAAGDLAGALIAQSRVARLVVLSAAGTDRWAGLLGRSAATRVAAHAACPTLAVRRARGDGPTLLGVDGSPPAAAAVPAAFEEASLRGTGLRAVYVCGHKDDLAAAAGLIGEAVAAWVDKHPDVEVRADPRVAARPDREIVALSAEASLAVVAASGAGGARLGSVTRGLLHHGGCPVLVIPVS